METIKIEINLEKLKNVIEHNVESILKNDYSNPVKTAIEAAIKEQDGPIKALVTEVIANAVSNPEFKEKISAAVIARMIEGALKQGR